MRYTLFAAVWLIVGSWSGGCAHGHPTGPDGTPTWLNGLVRQLETEAVTNPPAQIARYDYKGETVYFRPQWCCDQMSVLYRTDGSIMCHPDGGIAGTGDRRCPDFFDARRNEQVVWRDTRTR